MPQIISSAMASTSTANKWPECVRYRLQKVREAFNVMVRKKMAKGTTFEENLHLVYLSQGFRQEQDNQGVEWLVKQV